MPRAKLLRHYDVDQVNDANYALSEDEKAQLLKALNDVDNSIDYPIDKISDMIEDYRRIDVILQLTPTEGDYKKTKDTICDSIKTIQDLIMQPDMREAIDFELVKRTDLNIFKVVNFLNQLDRCIALSGIEPFYHPFIDTQRENKVYTIHSIAMELPISIPKTRNSTFEKICRVIFKFSAAEIDVFTVNNFLPDDMLLYIKEAIDTQY